MLKRLEKNMQNNTTPLAKFLISKYSLGKKMI